MDRYGIYFTPEGELRSVSYGSAPNHMIHEIAELSVDELAHTILGMFGVAVLINMSYWQVPGDAEHAADYIANYDMSECEFNASLTIFDDGYTDLQCSDCRGSSMRYTLAALIMHCLSWFNPTEEGLA